MYREMYNSIFIRKSCRKYSMEKLDDSFIEEMNEVIDSFDRLDENIIINHRITNKIKGRFVVEAPHYLVISGENNVITSRNIGFIYEQLILYLHTKGIGTVWQGGSKDAVNNNENDIIIIAFGKPLDDNKRDIAGFKRKDITEITNDVDNINIKAVHLAPSGLNKQPWYFKADNGKNYLYKKELGFPLTLAYKHTDIDMGIALSHYMLSTRVNNFEFNFTVEDGMDDIKGYSYFGTIL